MTVFAIIRPDSWNLPLFLHVLGAMVLVGALVLAATSLAAASRSGSEPMARLSFRALLWAAFPAWIVMRVAAELVAEKENLNGDNPPNWIDLGYMLAEPTLLLLIIATVLAGIGVRRSRTTGGNVRSVDRVATILVSVALLAYVVAIWAMTTKPT